jgi:hypothetical protein
VDFADTAVSPDTQASRASVDTKAFLVFLATVASQASAAFRAFLDTQAFLVSVA